VARLVQAASPDLNFYGVTQYGGSNNAGTVFKITSAGTLTSLHSFNVSDGYQPVAGLIQAASPDLNFYGTTQLGGASSQGTVFKVTSTGTITTLHSFVLSDGQQPVASVVQAASPDLNFYGTVFRGGTNADGTTFKITSTGTFTSLHTFIGSDGTEPMSGLIQSTDGNFYGTTPGNNSLTALKQQQFRDGVAEWAAFANLHFLEFTSGAAPTNFITAQEKPANQGEGGFSSSVGMAGGEQFVQCGLHSWNRGTVCHEVGHALGLWHEQQRPDRDTYVTINFSNIPTGLQPNFAIINNGQTFGTAYDFYSIMHYQRKTFAIDPNIDTIIMNAGYTQYADVIGNVYDRTLSKIERAGMAAVYGNPSPLPSAVVTNTNDSGTGSLRTAIYYAFDKSTDAVPAPTTVTFHIPTSDPNYNAGTGVFTIKPTYIMTALGNGTTIDGTSEATFLGSDTNPNGPEIALDGSNFTLLGVEPFNLFSPGLILRAANCTIKGLTIQNFNERGIDIYQGSDPNGSAATGNIIGGTTASARNVISGNATYGIGIHESTTTGNIIEGNYIGTSQSGSAAQPNAFAGVVIYLGAHGNTVGGTGAGAGNVLSGNTYQGIFIGDTGSNNNLVQGNFIGTNPTGSSAVPNLVGVEITNGAQANTVGGTSGATTRNVVSGNTADGIQVHDSGTLNNLIEGNYIGLASDGATPLPNGGEGVQLYAGANSTTIGGTTAGTRNVISGNIGDGIIINASNGTTVQGNYIGTDLNGTTAKPNGNAGIYVWAGSQNTTVGGTSSSARNVVSGNSGDGIDLNGVSNTTVQGNYVGLDVNGSTAKANGGSGVALFTGATSNTIGGLVSGARNIISGNSGDGIYLGGVSNNLVQGNYVGVNVAGSGAIGNGSIGIAVLGGAQTNTVGGNVAAARNVIAASGFYDVAVAGTGTSGNIVLGNNIGLDATGLTGFTNNNSGVAVYGGAQNNVIGGTSGGSRNFISGHGQYGLFIADSGTSGNLVQGNTIGLNISGSSVPNTSPGVAFFNSSQLNSVGGSAPGASNLISGNSNEGIAVYSFNTTTVRETFSRNSIFGNGAKGIALYNGGNNSQPAPASLSALVSTAANANGTDVSGTFSGSASTLEFFASPAADPSGFGEGQYFIGSMSVAGSGSFTAHLAAVVPAGYVIAATSTDANGNTSEFSQDATVPAYTDNGGDGTPDQWMQSHFGHIDPRVSDK
jgi:uncharacterized repeat protein (TIGR03803 family)/parallel beta-helix repeat protein